MATILLRHREKSSEKQNKDEEFFDTYGNHGEYDDTYRERGPTKNLYDKYDNSYHVLVKRAKKIDDSNSSIQVNQSK